MKLCSQLKHDIKLKIFKKVHGVLVMLVQTEPPETQTENTALPLVDKAERIISVFQKDSFSALKTLVHF